MVGSRFHVFTADSHPPSRSLNSLPHFTHLTHSPSLTRPLTHSLALSSCDPLAHALTLFHALALSLDVLSRLSLSLSLSVSLEALLRSRPSAHSSTLKRTRNGSFTHSLTSLQLRPHTHVRRFRASPRRVLDFTSRHAASRHAASRLFTSLHFQFHSPVPLFTSTSLHFTSLHFTSTSTSLSSLHSPHCASLNSLRFTSLHCTSASTSLHSVRFASPNFHVHDHNHDYGHSLSLETLSLLRLSLSRLRLSLSLSLETLSTLRESVYVWMGGVGQTRRELFRSLFIEFFFVFFFLSYSFCIVPYRYRE